MSESHEKGFQSIEILDSYILSIPTYHTLLDRGMLKSRVENENT